MTEVAALLSADQQEAVARLHENGVRTGLELVEPGETVATTKEEEWVSKKKTEVTNTKQIETRVKRQVVLEDGRVVEDSGPVVTTNTTEDTETQEHHQTELRKLGGDDVDGNQAAAIEVAPQEPKEDVKWVAVPNPDGLVREVKERRVISREEIEEVKETEDVQHLGDITDEEFLIAVKSGRKDLREALRSKSEQSGRAVVSTGPRVVQESTRSNKVTDVEETKESSSVRPDGRIVTETQRTTEHEVLKDDELPEGAPDRDEHLESSQRYLKTKNQEDVEYLADGVTIGHEMRYKAETMEVERRGDGIDEPDWDSLSARARRRTNVRQPHRYRDVLPTTSPMDRKDALTKKPLDFDQEEETRKVETSKWLENHFGSESRSSKDSIDDDDDEQPPKTSFFNVTIKSQPAKPEPMPAYVQTGGSIPRSYNQPEPERERERNHTGYFQGVSEWSERRKEAPNLEKHYSPVRERVSPLGTREYQRSPIPDYRTSPVRDHRVSPIKEKTPTPPQRKKAVERRQRISQDSRYDSGYRTPSRNETRDSREEPQEEPPPDYSPPSPPTMPVEKKHQKTRFAIEPMKHKSGNIIGQSIRKLVGKIRSASAERKARHRAKRSPSPSYQKGNVIDSNINHDQMDAARTRRTASPVHRYYLGEDPFGGSIYGRENKYDGVRPVRNSRKPRGDEENRSQSTLGRFSKSTGRLASSAAGDPRATQTLPRHATKTEVPSKLATNNRSNSTINVSIINTVSSPRPIVNGGPAKPARTYKSNLSRSQSFNVHAGDPNARRTMHKSNPQLNRLDEVPAGLKSPALISSINRSQQNLAETVDETYTPRFARNGYSESGDKKRVFMKGLRDRAPELFKTLHESDDDSWRNAQMYNTAVKPTAHNYNGDIYEPPTRLRDTNPTTTRSVIRRGSSSSNDYSETYHTTSRGADPLRPSITNTVQSFTKKTIPGKGGKGMETIESTEKKSVTKSRYVAEPKSNTKYYGTERRYLTSSGSSPVVIEVRNNYRK